MAGNSSISNQPTVLAPGFPTAAAATLPRGRWILVGAFERIWTDAQNRGIPLRTAAFVVACERVLAAREQRGLYP